MSLSVQVRLRHGRYDAGGTRPSGPEWPPHPTRVFCALVASAVDRADWDGLRWLESADAPEVWAAQGLALAGRADSYVVTNATDREGGSQFWPGRTNGFRSRSFITPDCDRFAIVWPSAEPAPEIVAVLRRLARRVPYVGRSTSPAEVTVTCSLPDGPASWSRLVPTRLGDTSAVGELRIPYRGYTDALQQAYDQGVPAYHASRPPVAYAELAPAPASPVSPAVGPWEDLIVWGWQRPMTPISGDQIVQVATAFRKAVLSRVADPIPAQVSGHGADGRAHAGFFALPDVGHEHADGHLIGLALAIPRDLPADEWKQLVRGVAGGRLASVRVWRDRDLRLTREAGLRGLQPEWWTGGLGGARDWVTVTPVVCDGRLRERRTLGDLVRRSLRIAGFPDPGPDGVEVSPAPLTAGAVLRPRAGTLPAGRPRWPQTHARVRFPQPVTGPVAAGALRYLGLGLFIPDRSRSWEH